MNSPGRTARIAGALYLLSAIAAGVPLLYLSGALIVDGDAAATAHNLLASEMVFRCCMVSELAGAVLFLLLAATLYRLLHEINRRLAVGMVALVLLSVPITFLNVGNEMAALTLAQGPGFLSSFSLAQRQALAMLFLGLHANGASVANVFWGLWLFPFGLLVIKSRFIPRWLGIWLIADGAALVCVSLTALLSPSHLDLANRIAILPELGELAMIGWLLIRGVRATKLFE